MANFWNSVWNFTPADEEAREAVVKGAHKVMPASERAGLIHTLCASVCGDAEADAVVEIMEFSMQKGDAMAVLDDLGGAGKAADWLLWYMDGARDARMRQIFDQLGVSY